MGEEEKTFLFCYVGHGVEINKSLNIMMSNGAENDVPSFTFYDIESELIAMSETSPVVAFLNCNRMDLSGLNR